MSADTDVRKNVEVDLGVMDYFEDQVKQLESYIIRHAKKFDNRTYHRLQSVPGIGAILALVIMYEVQDISRFPTVQSFCSYGRLVKCSKESVGKCLGFGSGKIGNAHLKWAMSDDCIDAGGRVTQEQLPKRLFCSCVNRTKPNALWKNMRERTAVQVVSCP